MLVELSAGAMVDDEAPGAGMVVVVVVLLLVSVEAGAGAGAAIGAGAGTGTGTVVVVVEVLSSFLPQAVNDTAEIASRDATSRVFFIIPS